MVERPDLLAVVSAFARTLRSCGVAADPVRTRTAAEALAEIDLGDRSLCRAALSAALCSCQADREPFELAFALFFGGWDGRTTAPVNPVTVLRPRFTAVEPPSESGDCSPRPQSSAASEREVLRTADLAGLTDAERREVHALISALRPAGPTRPGRRRHPARTGDLDRARTARETLRHGGEPTLRHARIRPRSRRLVLLVDVSGSMSAYADAYLRFAHAVVRRRHATEVFTLGTRLTRVSRQLAEPDPDIALERAGAAVPDWSGGTRLGAQLKAFNSRWGRRGTARGAVVVVFSDGWERGGAELLGAETAVLDRLAHAIVWVNPHRGRPGFEPATAGMRAVLPYIDVLHEGHAFASLRALADLLSDQLVPEVVRGA